MKLDVFIGDNDQPTTCPKCGVRTEFVFVNTEKQFHTCPKCDYIFYVIFEKESK